jgi:phenylacetate-CoA ligase
MAIAFEDRLHAALGLYMRAPEWLREPVGAAYRWLPPGWRHGRAFARFAEDAAGDFEAAPWAQVERRLATTLSVAAEVPAYAAWRKELLDEGRPPLERLRLLPAVGKPNLKRQLEAHVRQGSSPGARHTTFTGGSTEHPMRFYLHRGITRAKEAAWIAAIEARVLGTRSGDWTLSLRGRTVASAAADDGRLWTVEPIKRHLLFSVDHLEPRHMARHVHALRQWRPTTIHAFPSALHPLALWLARHPCPEFTAGVRGILLTSENVLPEQIHLLRRVFPGARIVPHYGHSERALMALGDADGRYRFLPMYGLPELLDAHGRPIDAPGIVGEIAGTSFDNGVMPFLRYRTGDFGCWDHAPVTQGLARFTLRSIEGRAQEFVVCRDRRLVSVTTLGAAHFESLAEVTSIQFEQHEPGRVDLKIVTERALPEHERRRIVEAVRAKTQGGCEVALHEVASIERTSRGKQRLLVQHLDLSGYLGAGGVEALDRRDGA